MGSHDVIGATAHGAIEQMDPAAAGPSNEGSQRRILIVDDNIEAAKDLMRSHDSGFDAHLVKPIDCEALIKILAADIGVP
jgi:hypothetical protein